MKTKYVLILLLLTSVAFSCKKCDQANQSSANPIEGSWRITSFVANNSDKADEYSSYIFQFYNNHQLGVNGGATTGMMNKCNWSNNNNIYHFSTMGMQNNSLNALDGNWTLISMNGDSCKLKSNDKDCCFVMSKK